MPAESVETGQLIRNMVEAVRAERETVRAELGLLAARPGAQITDGARIHDEPGAYSYRFSCELEAPLAEGERVRVVAAGSSVTAEVTEHDVASERLELVLVEDLGPEVAEARLELESTLLLDLLVARLEALETGARSLAHAAAFLAGDVPVRPAVDFQDARLTEAQQRAIGFVLGQQIAYVWGPPGTGKTRTVAHLVEALLGEGDRVLLCAHTNVATDTALHRFLELGTHVPGEVVRVGYQGELLRPFHVGLDDLVDSRIRDVHPDVASSIDRLCGLVASGVRRRPSGLVHAAAPLGRRLRIARELLAQIEPGEERSAANAGLAEAEATVAQIEKDVIDQARVVATTLTRLYTSPILRDHTADTVVVDEASVASLVLAFLAGCCATRRSVAVGDFMQLPAIVRAKQPQARTYLGQHVFASAGCDRPEKDHPLRVMLDEQFRMHPQISSVVSRLFYAGRLTDAPVVRARPRSSDAVMLLDTTRTGAISESTATGSKRNEVHADLVARIVQESHASEIAVIAPYRAQVRLLRDRVRRGDPGSLRSGRIQVFTVHRYQGQDRSLVILDLVEAPGTGCRFLDERHVPEAANLINVALSRAKDSLVIVAHASHLVSALGRASLLGRLFREIRTVGGQELDAARPDDLARLARILGAEGG